jgi:hypothetical protein
MAARVFISAVALIFLSTNVHASCRDDLKELKPHIDHMKSANQTRYYLALKWYGRALEEEKASETACITYATRAKKALFDPLPEVQNCYGPNRYLPQCQYGGATQPGGPGVPGFGGPVGGGAGGGAVAPVGPVTAGSSPTFTPPGGLSSQSLSKP